MNSIRRLYYGRIDIFEGTVFIKTSRSKECDICHYWYFVNKGFIFQSNVCNGCHDVLLMMTMNLCDIAVLNINGAGYNSVITRISKSGAINLMQNIDLGEKPNIIK